MTDVDGGGETPSVETYGRETVDNLGDWWRRKAV